MPPSQSNPAANAAGNPRPPAIPSMSFAVDHQIATSNATASAFLGGRQLKWMTPGSTARRPNPPRPAITRHPVPPPAPQPQYEHPFSLSRHEPDRCSSFGLSDGIR